MFIECSFLYALALHLLTRNFQAKGIMTEVEIELLSMYWISVHLSSKALG